MKKTQKGMTLIELVIVIIVLGIIAAVAAPKFADISGNAATAAQDGSRGAMLSAFTIAVASSQGIPTWTEYTARIGEMTCGAADGLCTSNDFDSEGTGDLEFKFFNNAACATAITGAGDSVVSFKEGAVNTAVVLGDACVELN